MRSASIFSRLGFMTARFALIAFLPGALFAQFDSRLTVHTIVRENMFAGFMANDMDRFHKGQQTLEKLMAERPEQKADILAWQGSGALYEAILAREAGRADEYAKLHKLAMQRYAEADQLGAGNPGVAAVQGGSFFYLGDRLAPEHRAA